MNTQTQRSPPTEGEAQPAAPTRENAEQVVELPLAELHSFKNHPFHVVDDTHI